MGSLSRNLCLPATHCTLHPRPTPNLLPPHLPPRPQIRPGSAACGGWCRCASPSPPAPAGGSPPPARCCAGAAAAAPARGGAEWGGQGVTSSGEVAAGRRCQPIPEHFCPRNKSTCTHPHLGPGEALVLGHRIHRGSCCCRSRRALAPPAPLALATARRGLCRGCRLSCSCSRGLEAIVVLLDSVGGLGAMAEHVQQHRIQHRVCCRRTTCKQRGQA